MKKLNIVVMILAVLLCCGSGKYAYDTHQESALAKTQYEEKIAQSKAELTQYKEQAVQLQADLDEKQSKYEEQLSQEKDTSYKSGYDEGYRVGYEKGRSEAAAAKSSTSNASSSGSSSGNASSVSSRSASSGTSQSNSATVYITNTGSKYHRSGCSYLRQSSNAISLSQAKSYGYEPCSRCNPPS